MKYENPELEDDKKKQLMAWFQNICNPQFNLIGGLVSTFIDNTQDKDLSRKILKVLKKLNEHLPELVCD